MTNKLTLTEQEELFVKDCKLINLKYEYNGYTGDERWAIITELSVKELWEKYPLVIERYSPFVHLSIAQGEVIDDANRNEDKYAKRSSRTLDCYGYDDEMSSQFHKELAIMFDDPFERAEEERLELEREELRQCEIRKARIALSMLQPLQRERLMKNVCCGLSSRAIAKQEGVYYSSVDKSIVYRIYDFKTGCVITECLHEGWQTSGSVRVIRMAFNLYCNGTPSVSDYEDAEEQVDECRQYTVEEIFCCAYAPYFWQAIQIRYPEYATYNHKLYALLGGTD